MIFTSCLGVCSVVLGEGHRQHLVVRLWRKLFSLFVTGRVMYTCVFLSACVWVHVCVCVACIEVSSWIWCLPQWRSLRYRGRISYSIPECTDLPSLVSMLAEGSSLLPSICCDYGLGTTPTQCGDPISSPPKAQELCLISCSPAHHRAILSVVSKCLIQTRRVVSKALYMDFQAYS